MIEQKLIIKGTKILPSNVGIIKCHSALKVPNSAHYTALE